MEYGNTKYNVKALIPILQTICSIPYKSLHFSLNAQIIYC